MDNNAIKRSNKFSQLSTEVKKNRKKEEKNEAVMIFPNIRQTRRVMSSRDIQETYREDFTSSYI